MSVKLVARLLARRITIVTREPSPFVVLDGCPEKPTANRNRNLMSDGLLQVTTGTSAPGSRHTTGFADRTSEEVRGVGNESWLVHGTIAGLDMCLTVTSVHQGRASGA